MTVPGLLRQSPRAVAVDLRTYRRPLDEAGTAFETREQMVHRSTVEHHSRLWEEAGGNPDAAELAELERLALCGLSSVAGRTQWLGGTPYAFERACCQFNCSATEAATVYDVVDVAWLLLNGCGVGAKPRAGTLHGYVRPVELEIVPSTRGAGEKGAEANGEDQPSDENGWTWTIRVGDSAAAWAKAIGKMFISPARARKLRLDFREIRGAGGRLKGYGWICNGSRPLQVAMTAIHDILNASAGELLDEVQVGDAVNWLGTILSSRRAAEILVMDAHNPRADEFAALKKDYYSENEQRRQSNNTLQFWSKPSRRRIEELLRHADECGGDPGICNAEAALRKCPWFVLPNPCHEIQLPSHGFCNLVTSCLPRFRRNFAALERAVYVIARANYRQTCVDLEDGILQPAWHQTNQALRLCGVSLTGIVQADWLTDYQVRRLRNAAVTGAYSMADELGLPRPKAVTTGKPEGTGSKTWGSVDLGEVTEGIHKPLGRWIFNWINFSVHDPLVGLLEAAGYKVLPSPSDPNNMLVCFPVSYHNVRFDVVDGKEVNLEPAVVQLDRYLRWNVLWADHNMSTTVSYSPEEVPAMADWLDRNWDNGFIAVALLRRNDPTKTAKDMGHPYLPQEVVLEAVYREYAEQLRGVAWEKVSGIYELDAAECARGACPVK